MNNFAAWPVNVNLYFYYDNFYDAFLALEYGRVGTIFQSDVILLRKISPPRTGSTHGDNKMETQYILCATEQNAT